MLKIWEKRDEFGANMLAMWDAYKYRPALQVCVCARARVCLCASMCVCLCVCVFVCVHTHICAYVSVCLRVCVCVLCMPTKPSLPSKCVCVRARVYV